MIDIKVKSGPVHCTKCDEPLLASQARKDCEACKRPYHQTCWDEAGGCVDCPEAKPEPEAGGSPAPTTESAPASAKAEAGEATAGHGHGHHVPKGPPTWLEREGNLKKLTYAVYAAAGVMLLFEVLAAADVLYHKHVHEGFDWEGWPGFYAIYGFVAYSLVVVVGMGLQKIVSRKEDYYDE